LQVADMIAGAALSRLPLRCWWIDTATKNRGLAGRRGSKTKKSAVSCTSAVLKRQRHTNNTQEGDYPFDGLAVSQ